MADSLKKRYDGIVVELIKSGGGAFEVRRDGELLYSKLKEGRFPEDSEIYGALDG